jgi:hypothetical protein
MCQDIKVTPEMIEAGADAYRELDWDTKFSDIIQASDYDVSVLVSRVFLAMARRWSYNQPSEGEPEGE